MKRLLASTLIISFIFSGFLTSCSNGDSGSSIESSGGTPGTTTTGTTGTTTTGTDTTGGSTTTTTGGTTGGSTATGTDTSSASSGVMLQGFNWNSCNTSSDWYVIMKNNASAIKNTFEYVWCPPATDSCSSNGYMPRQLNSLESAYGSETELKAMISSLSPAKAIADVVINHRVGTTCWGDFTNPSFGTSKGSNYQAICSDDEGFDSSSGDSHMYSVAASLRGAADTGDGYSSARDLDHTNTTVQSGIIDWMNDKLKAAGFVGWRYDFVKGYGGKYVGYYNSKTSAEFSVGEYWPTAGYSSTSPETWGNLLESWCDATAETLNSTAGTRSKVFDFTLKGAMNTVFGTGGSSITNSNYALLADASNIYIGHPADAVTFVDNHDTGSTQALWYLDPDDVGTAYALILTHPGYPCVAWQHYFTASQSSDTDTTTNSQYTAGTTVAGTSNTLRQHIDKLMGYRKTYGITNVSACSTLQASSSVYASKVTGTKGALIVVIGSGYTPSDSSFTKLYSGTDFAVWGNLGNDEGTTETSSTVDLTLTTTSGWVWNDSCRIFATTDGGSTWILCTGSADSSSSATIYATVPSDAESLYCVRCPSGTTVSTVGSDSSTEIYNTSETVSLESGTTACTIIWN